MVATLNQTSAPTQTPSKADRFKGQDDVKADLFPPYVGTVLEWDFDDREEKKFGSDEKITVTYLRLTVDPLTKAAKTTDGLIRLRWKTSFTQQGNIRPGSTHDVALQTIARAMREVTGNKEWKVKTSANMDELVGQTLKFGQVDPTRDDLFAKVKAEFREKMKPVEVVLGAPPADWEDDIPGDLAEQKIAAMAEAVKAQEERRQNEAASVGEEISATPVEAEAVTSSYDLDEETTSYLVSWLEGKKIASIGMIAYQDKELKATLDGKVFSGIQNKSVQSQLKEAGLIVEGKDGLYHAAGA